VGETFKRKIGPLPVWMWFLLLVVVVAIFLNYRKNKAAAAAAAQQNANNLSTNLGTTPVSNLTTAAQPMPIQLGDTFVSTTVPNTVNVSPSTTVNNPPPPSSSMQPAPPPPTSPATTVKPTPAASGGVMVNPSLPGYGAGLQDLLNKNPGLLSANTPGGKNIPGVTGFKVMYNGVPL
jgi:hypothetical protein